VIVLLQLGFTDHRIAAVCHDLSAGFSSRHLPCESAVASGRISDQMYSRASQNSRFALGHVQVFVNEGVQLKELDREHARKRPGGFLLRMTRKV